MSSAKSIRDWLTELDLAQHADAFEREQIDLDAVRHLTGDDLKDLGLPMGHRAKLLAAIRALEETPSQGPGERQRSSPQSYTPRHLAEKILHSRSALEGERKQVTVLFCDIANSTQLAEQAGAEPMHGILSRFFELALEQVHRYEGTVNQFLGDGFMALFGAPVAHEDDARRGVLSALGIRRALTGPNALLGLPAGFALSVRMGLHTGPVVVGSIGDNLRMDYTAIGDTTNLAARLEQHAQPGEILVSEVTARLVKGYANVEPLRPLAVKGKAEPIGAFRVTAPGHRRSRLEQERAEGPVYTFKHVLTQEVAYESLLSARRQALHESAGRALERFYPDRIEEHCEVLAHHFSRSANKEKALDYLELANRKAAQANAVVDARAYFEQAMSVARCVARRPRAPPQKDRPARQPGARVRADERPVRIPTPSGHLSSDRRKSR